MRATILCRVTFKGKAGYRFTPIDRARRAHDVFHSLFGVCLAPSRGSSFEAITGSRLAPFDRALFIPDAFHSLFGVRLTIFRRVALDGETGLCGVDRNESKADDR